VALYDEPTTAEDFRQVETDGLDAYVEGKPGCSSTLPMGPFCGKWKARVVKLDNDLNEIWEAVLGYFDTPMDLELDASGHVLVGGYSLGPHMATWVIDPNGELCFEDRNAGGIPYGYGNSLALTEGSFYLSGWTWDQVLSYGGALVKYDWSNQPPTANAGPDQTIQAIHPDGTAPVTLDGSASSDPDEEDPLTFEWTEGGTFVASGEWVTVLLGLGEHWITLAVGDGMQTALDDVRITVVATPSGVATLVDEFAQSGDLDPDLVTTLDKHLGDAEEQLSKGKPDKAIQSMDQFKHAVDKEKDKGKITAGGSGDLTWRGRCRHQRFVGASKLTPIGGTSTSLLGKECEIGGRPIARLRLKLCLPSRYCWHQEKLPLPTSSAVTRSAATCIMKMVRRERVVKGFDMDVKRVSGRGGAEMEIP
jgi:hypothetical protein